MSLPSHPDQFGTVVGAVVGLVRQRLAGEDGVEIDRVDRMLAAATLAAGVVAVLWPQGRKAPMLVANGTELARAAWKRRNWFLLRPS